MQTSSLSLSSPSFVLASILLRATDCRSFRCSALHVMVVAVRPLSGGRCDDVDLNFARDPIISLSRVTHIHQGYPAIVVQ
jgi:hypothetical protein